MVKKNSLFILLILASVVVLVVNLRINIFRYNNFDFGKFDLGNMTQMEWNTLHGRFLYLTDYFGTNLPRWAMSHVDPILLVFVPIFAVFQNPLTLVFSQLLLVIFSSLLVFKIAELELKSKLAGFLFGMAYLFYPAVGYLIAQTGFHGVTAVIPFFLGAFYVFEKMYKEKKYTKRKFVIFWLLLILTMAGKEQLPIYVLLYGLFILVLRNNVPWESFKSLKNFLFSQNGKLGLSVFSVGLVWFITAFFIIIPAFAPYRVAGFKKFAQSIDLNTAISRDVENANYFLSRYAEFGSTYQEILTSLISNPQKVVVQLFGGDKGKNMIMTFTPMGYLPLAYPAVLAFAVPDLLINFLTTEGGIGTSEITNHRISMIIPVLFISSIYAVGFLSNLIAKLLKNNRIKGSHVALLLAAAVLGLNVYTTFNYNNPVYLWLTQAIQKRLTGSVAFAKEDLETAGMKNMQIGQVLRLSKLESKDRECAERVVKLIPPGASVSGPDYLGAHLSMRETYAIFPALYKEADYVIVDVFSRKILTILDVDLSVIRDVVGNIIKDDNYRLDVGCGNLFVFKRVGPHGKPAKLPVQEHFSYKEVYNYQIFQNVYVVDYTLPKTLRRAQNETAQFVYVKRGGNDLGDYVLFMTFINEATGEIYQIANLSSYGLAQLSGWAQDKYYVEDLDLALPSYLRTGDYKAFIGISNGNRTRSIYLGNVEVL